MGAEQFSRTESATPIAPAGRVRYGILAWCCVLAVIVYLQRVGFAQAGSALTKALGLSELQWSILVGTAFLIPYGIGEVPCGLISDRLGSRHLMTLLVAVWSLMTASVLIVGLLPLDSVWPFVFLLATRVVFGLFQAGTFPVFARIFADWMPMSERATAQGFIWMAARAGGALSPYVLIPLIALFEGWQLPLFWVAMLGFAWCAVFWPWFRDQPREMPQVGPAERALIAAGRRPLAAHQRVPWGLILRSPSVRGLCYLYSLGGVGASFFVTLLPIYLKKHRHLADRECMLLAFLPLAAGTVACLLGGRIADGVARRGVSKKWGRRMQGVLAQLVAGLALASIAWVPSDAVLLLGIPLTLAFFSNDLNQGPAWAAATDIGEKYAGTVGGLMNMCGALFVGATMPGVGSLLEWGLTTDMFLLFGATYATGALCWFMVDVTKPLTADGS